MYKMMDLSKEGCSAKHNRESESIEDVGDMFKSEPTFPQSTSILVGFCSIAEYWIKRWIQISVLA